ncbi:TonB-dependent receptor [Mucilaginibacter gynuensis]|uniref:TonB-dependent receptor n=1 Tax=Mucilaginibacter gynuensis TaxID=1302236 RepID=A0ABP8GEI4_9SPHI
MFAVLFLASSAYSQDMVSIKGRVLNENGEPVARATVSLSPDNHLTETDSKGSFSMKRIYTGLYRVQISCVGYEMYSGEVNIKGQDAALEYTLKASNDELQQVDIVARGQNAPDNLIKAENSAMPVTVITRETIEKMGSRRLDEVLKEQTGMAIVNNIAGGARSVGVQMQGFSSDYIMVLIDGQPMLGRNNGSLDLSRISVSNIERIEIIKGASSCLYGSEALGGAINIITRYGATQPQASINYQYGSLNISDATLEAETPFADNRGYVNISGNFYHSDGFNTNPKYILNGTTAPPYDNYSFQGRGKFQVSKNSSIGLTGRYGLRKSFMTKDFGLGIISSDTQDEAEINLSASFDHRFNDKLRGLTRYYFTNFDSNVNLSWLQGGTGITDNTFVQRLHRFEQQFSYQPNTSLNLTGGVGYGIEQMSNMGEASPNDVQTGFAFAQANWRTTDKLTTTAGLRYDFTNSFGGSVNPSLGFNYQLTNSLKLKAGVGTGFKAPDFKSRYLVFFNPVANYFVVGNEVLRQTIETLSAQGEISEIRSYLYNQLTGNLKAEQNTSYNAGTEWQLSKNFKLEAGVFYHRLRNQINAIQVATGSGNRPIYTYQNLPEAVNKGIEASFSIRPLKDVEISAGYQYLIAKDLSVVDSIKKGNYPYNQNIHDPKTGNSYPPTPSSYFGIENRSRHMANLKVFYVYAPWDMSINSRLTYRSKYPFADANGNQFIDRYDTFVGGFALWNMAVEKRLMKEHLTLRITADNIMGYTDPLIPGQPGRVILAGINYRFFKD